MLLVAHVFFTKLLNQRESLLLECYAKTAES